MSRCIALSLACFLVAAGARGVEFPATQPYDKLSMELVTPHIPFARPYYRGKLTALVIAPCWQQRETVELAQRLSLDFTPLMTAGSTSFGPYRAGLGDNYGGIRADRFTALVDERLGPGARYDLIIIGKMPWDAFPSPVQEMVLNKVHAGTGLLYVCPAKLGGGLETACGDDATVRAALLGGVPIARMPLLKEIAPERLVRTGTLGEGRVVFINYHVEEEADWLKTRGVLESLTPEWSDDPLYYDYYFSLLAKAATWAAKKEPEVIFEGMPAEGITVARDDLVAGNITFALKGATDAAGRLLLRHTVRDRNNVVEAEQVSPCRLGQVSLSLPLLREGEKILDFQVKDAEGRVINWASVPLVVASPLRVENVRCDKEVYRKGEKVSAGVSLSAPMPEGVSLRVELWDTHGRNMVSARCPVQGTEATCDLPLDYPLTRACTLRASLLETNAVLSQAECRFNVALTDTPCAPEDFSLIMWGGAYGNCRSVRTYLAQFARHGVDTLYVTSACWDGFDKSREIARRVAEANLLAAPYATRIFLVSDKPNHTHLHPVEGVGGPAIRNCELSVPAETWSESGPAKHLKDLARAYGPLGPLFYSLGDENCIANPGMPVDKADVCFCANCLQSFRAYLKTIYPDLAALNREWGTAYQAWDKVTRITLAEAQKTDRYPQWVDHRRHMDRLFTDYHVRCIKTITDVDPEARVGIEGLVYPTRPYMGFNLPELLPHMRFYSPYKHLPEIHAHTFVPEGAVTSTFYGSYRGNMGEGIMRYMPWQRLFEGMNSVFWWTSGGGGLGGPACMSPDYRPLLHFRQTSEEIREIKSGIGKLLLASRRKVHPIGVFYSNACLYGSVIRPRETLWRLSMEDFHYAIRDARYQYRYVSPHDVTSGRLGDYRVVILPYSQALSAQEAEALKAFVNRGGVLMADFVPGIMDEHGKSLDPGSLQDAFGEWTRLAVTKYGKGCTVYLGDYVKGYHDKRKRGAGKGVAAGLARFLTDLGGIAPFAKVENKDSEERLDVEVSLFENAKAKYLCLIRAYGHQAGPQAAGPEGDMEGGMAGDESTLTRIALPQEWHVYDTRAKRYLGKREHLVTTLRPAQAQVFALLPAVAEGVQVKLDRPTYGQGDLVRFDATVSPPGLEDAGLALRVEVLDPDGGTVPHYAQTVLSEGGRFRGAIPLSLNERPGTYRLVAREVATGLESVLAFDVE